jgi:hypothetical protein
VALFWCNWCLYFGALPKKRKRLYQLLQCLLNFHLAGSEENDFRGSLGLFYQEDELHEATSILQGTTTFPGLNFAKTWTEISSQQNNLLKIYQRVNSIKSTFVP